jgi:hypothetical protein
MALQQQATNTTFDGPPPPPSSSASSSSSAAAGLSSASLASSASASEENAAVTTEGGHKRRKRIKFEKLSTRLDGTQIANLTRDLQCIASTGAVPGYYMRVYVHGTLNSQWRDETKMAAPTPFTPLLPAMKEARLFGEQLSATFNLPGDLIGDGGMGCAENTRLQLRRRLSVMVARVHMSWCFNIEIEEPGAEQLTAINNAIEEKLGLGARLLSAAEVKCWVFNDRKVTNDVKEAYATSWASVQDDTKNVLDMLSIDTTSRILGGGGEGTGASEAQLTQLRALAAVVLCSATDLADKERVSDADLELVGSGPIKLVGKEGLFRADTNKKRTVVLENGTSSTLEGLRGAAAALTWTDLKNAMCRLKVLHPKPKIAKEATSVAKLQGTIKDLQATIKMLEESEKLVLSSAKDRAEMVLLNVSYAGLKTVFSQARVLKWSSGGDELFDFDGRCAVQSSGGASASVPRRTWLDQEPLKDAIASFIAGEAVPEYLQYQVDE